VTPLLNAAAVSGEYLSAASFLGVAGLVLKDGMGALWYPVGFAAGYILMLVLVAAPMRRSGALTVPDFAEARLASPALRKLAAVVVLVIGGLYLVPQFRTSGLVLSVVSGTPYWVGVALAGAAVATTLALGGMRAATYVQAFQFFLKLLLFIIPALWLLLTVGSPIRDAAVNPTEFTPPVPGMPSGEEWQLPLLDLAGAGYPLLGTLAVLIATMLGTMGLPHVIMRFHTSPDGRAARRTAAITVGLLSVFYLFPGIYGALGRVLVPHLYVSGATDTAVVAMPTQVDTGWQGTLFTALLTAGAFAAFLATSLGLLLAVSGAIAHDLAPGGLGRLRVTVVVAAAVVVVLALFAAHLDAGVLVTWGFTVAASTFSPLLVLGIWWPRLTATGAICGVLAGLLGSSGAIALTLFGPELHGVMAILFAQPAPWTVPLAFLTMVLVSLRGQPPAWAMTAMLRLHLDEARTPVFERRSTWPARRWSTVRRGPRRPVG